MNQSAAFRDAIAAAGLTPPHEIIGDGDTHRFSSSGRPGDKSGWYRFHDDEYPAGAFGCWRSEMSVTWKSSKPKQFTDAERDEYRERMKRLEKQRERERQEATDYAAVTATQMWNDAVEADHPYLSRKQITCLGARVLGDVLLVPMKHSAKELVGLQRIWPDGTKRFIKGSPLAGAYMTIGTPTKDGTVVICEGYATGVSIHLATSYCVVVAFNSGNLSEVANKIRRALPSARLIIAGDDDAFTVRPGNHPQAGMPWNPGIEAANATGFPVYLPVWQGERDRGTDFNDLHVAEGLKAVRKCFRDPATLGTNPGAVSDKPPVQPVGDGDVRPSDNSGSSGGESPFAPDQAVHHESAPPVILPGGGSDVQVAAAPVVDYYAWLPDCNDKGKPLSTIENVAEVCRRLNITVRYNVISKEEEVRIPGASFSVDNKMNASLAWMISECSKFRMPITNVGDYLTYLADQNLYNPVANWVNSKPWDGVDRLSQLIDTVRACEQDANPKVMEMKRMFIRRWMLSAIAAVFRPDGVSAAGVLVFQGDQYIGKTKWFKTLVPAHLRVLQDGVILRPDDRDSVKQCVSNWLVELGELDATFRKSDIAALKSFLTKDRDILRRAFAKKESEYARRTVFFASVNPREFLHDPTGNRRYWTIECESLDHSHSIDMQQCWAQVHTLWQAGEEWYLSGEEVGDLNQHNKDFEVIDPIAELIGSGLNWKADKYDWQWLSATQVLKLLGRDTPSQGEATRAAHVIRDLNGKHSRKLSGVRQLYVPPVWKATDWENRP